MTERARRRRWVWGLSVVLVLGVTSAALVVIGEGRHSFAAGAASPAASQEPSADDLETPMVKVIHPRQDAGLQVTVHQLATVEAFYQSDMRARASGLVRSVPRDIGDSVRAGDLLLDVEVPDLDEDVAQKAVIISQRRQEKRVAEAKEKFAIAERDVAAAAVKQRTYEVGQAEAIAEAKRKQLIRFRRMAASDTIQPERVEEGERESAAANSAALAANAAVEKANADLKEKEAGIVAAHADVDLKGTLIEVARQDYERSLALAGFARLRSPFDGVIIARNVDPGSFVQNATTGSSETLISVARTDLVTVVAKFPDNAAPFIRSGIPAVIELDDLPDVTIAARVTRYAPAIRVSDRTVRVEVDLFNGDARELAPLAARTLAAHMAPLGAGGPLAAILLNPLGRELLAGQSKGPRDPLPRPAFRTTGARLLPGMQGTMRLELSRPSNSSVIPSTAFYTRGGKPYVLLVRDGQTRQVPVRVHVNDGTLAKVSLIERQRDASGSREVLRELAEGEEIVASRQIEIGPGQHVRTVAEDW